MARACRLDAERGSIGGDLWETSGQQIAADRAVRDNAKPRGARETLNSWELGRVGPTGPTNPDELLFTLRRGRGARWRVSKNE